MKRIILLLSIAFVLLGCEQPKGVYEKEVVCLVDHTDTGLVTLSFDQIRPSLTMTNSDNGIKFGIKSIEDNDFGNRLNVVLKPSSGADETQEERYLSKSAFYKQAKRAYDSLSHYRGAIPHSVIYRIIASELNELGKSKGPKNKILITQSDLFENSDVLNLYSTGDMKMLIEAPEKVKGILLKQMRILPLENTTVYFLFRPKNFQENSKYLSILAVYEQIITEAGGVVKTSF